MSVDKLVGFIEEWVENVRHYVYAENQQVVIKPALFDLADVMCAREGYRLVFKEASEEYRVYKSLTEVNQ